MKNIKLTESECISVQHILKYYAYQNSSSLDREDKEGIRKRQREARIEKEKKIAEEKRMCEHEAQVKELGPAYPKVWDLNYIREEAGKIFRKKRDDILDWDFFKFKIYVNEKGDYFTTNFYEDLKGLKWKNQMPEKIKDIRKLNLTLTKIFSILWRLYVCPKLEIRF